MDQTALFEDLANGKNTFYQKSGSPRKSIASLNDGGSEFNSVAASVVTTIAKMRSHLVKRAKDYLGIYSCLPGGCTMNDASREQLDSDVEAFITSCNKKVTFLQANVRKFTNSAQVIDHRLAVVELVLRYLNDFVKCYSELRTFRVKRLIEKQQMDQLEQLLSNKKPTNEKYTEECTEHIKESLPKGSLPKRSLHKSSLPEESRHDESLQMWQIKSTLTQEQLHQCYAEENSAFHDEMLSVMDEIRTIESKVVQIAKLQQLFTEKVTEQDLELSRLHDTAIRSSENVREGNELIRDAMMKNASTRAFFLFYIITLGLTILFLDWYNP